MTILSLKNSFKTTTNGVKISPTVSDYHPVILSAFAAKITQSTSRNIINKLTLNISSSTTATSGIITGNLGGSKTSIQSTPSVSNISLPPAISQGGKTVSFSGSSSKVEVINSFFIPPEESPFFPEGTSILDDVFVPNGEESQGVGLDSSEKPTIVGILAKELDAGIPDSVFIFFRPLQSITKKAKKYTLFKKDMTSNEGFKVIFDGEPSELISVSQRPDLLLAHPELKNAGFLVEDKNISKNGLFIYKIKVSWINKTADEIKNNSLNLASAATTLLGNTSWRSFI